MKNNYILVLASTVLYLVTTSCMSEKDNEPIEISETKPKVINLSRYPDYICDNKNKNLNISVLLDLSDRISYQNQMERDTAYLKSISKIFVNHVLNKRSLFVEDQIQLFFEPNPKSGITNQIAKRLKTKVTRFTKKEQIENIHNLYTDLPIKLYESALADENTTKGANIWGFFKNKVQEQCIEDCHRNILIILTDGYLYYENEFRKEASKTSYLNQKMLSQSGMHHNSWKATIKKKKTGILTATENLKDLEVLVLGIDKRKHKNPYAEDIIKHYWASWFQEMGIIQYKVKSTDLPNTIEKVVQDFLVTY